MASEEIDTSKGEIKEIHGYEEFVKFEDALQIAKIELISSLKLKQQSIKDSSTDEHIALKRKLHEFQIKNSELTQEISQGKLRVEEIQKQDIEAKLLKSNSVSESLHLQLSQKDEEIRKLSALLSSSSSSSFAPSVSELLLLQMQNGQSNVSSANLHGYEKEMEEQQVTTTNTDLRVQTPPVTFNRNGSRTVDNSNLNPPSPPFRIRNVEELREPSEENNDSGYGERNTVANDSSSSSNYDESRMSVPPGYSRIPNTSSIQTTQEESRNRKTEMNREGYSRLNDCGSTSVLYNPEFPADNREPVPYSPASPTPMDQLGLIRQIKIEAGEACRLGPSYVPHKTSSEIEQETENGNESHNTEINQSMNSSDFGQTSHRADENNSPQSPPASPNESEEEDSYLFGWQRRRSVKSVKGIKGQTEIEKRTAVKIEMGLEQIFNENAYPNPASSPAPTLPLKSATDSSMKNLNDTSSSSASSASSSHCSNLTISIPGLNTIDRRRTSAASFQSTSSDSTTLCETATTNTIKTTTTIINSSNNTEKEQTPMYHFENRPISVMRKQKRQSSPHSPLITTTTTTTTKTNDAVSSPKRRRRVSDASSIESGSGHSGNFNTSIPSEISTSLKEVPELYRQNYGFINDGDMDKCVKSRDFWYESRTTKYFIRFYDDDKGRWQHRKLHVKQQIGLNEPQVLLIKYREILVKLQTHQNKNKEKQKDDNPNSYKVRIWMDVRDFCIFQDLDRFFLDFGNLITHFSFGRRLYSSSEEICPFSLLNLILESMPSLEYLALNDNMFNKPNAHMTVKKVSSSKSLVHLKTIRFLNFSFRFNTPFITDLILRTPALEEIFGMPLHCIPQIEQFFLKKLNQSIHAPPWIISSQQKQVEHNHHQNQNEAFNVVGAIDEKEPDCPFALDLKGHSLWKLNINMNCIKSVKSHRSSYNANHVERRSYHYDLTALFRLRVPLEKVDTRVFFISGSCFRAQCKQQWSEILLNIAPNIKILKIEPTESGGPAIKIPRLENCQTLHLNMWISSRANVGYFPQGLDIKETFPSLKTVEIYLDEKSSNSFHSDSLRGKKTNQLLSVHFPSDIFHSDKFPNVKRLHLVRFMPCESIDKFQKLFPHVTILNLKHLLPKISTTLPSVFKHWTGLKQLILELNFSGHMNFNLDQAFTGIPFSKCWHLKAMSTEPKMIQERINQFQQTASIANLKGLNLLKIILLNNQPMDDGQLSDCIMTPVSAHYGFGPNRMPDLKVVVGFDDRVGHKDKECILRILEPMSPFLTIDDWS